MKNLLLPLLLASVAAHADEVQCLAETIYAESRGEPLEGQMAVGQAAINRAQRSSKTICELIRDRVMQARKIPAAKLRFYRLLALELLTEKLPRVLYHADSWNTGNTPAFRGALEKVIGRHVFYRVRAI